MALTRRTFVTAVSAIPFAVWFEKYANAFMAPHIRHNASSVQGQAMLKIYAEAVCKMRALPQTDPVGWLFQWYTHNVKGGTTKAAAISSVFGGGSSPQKTLAQDAWSTCQPHNAPGVGDYFLPWHRMYVYFFERIIRKVSGKAEFTLPYWNYSVSGAAHGVLPKQFRMSADPVFKCLFMSNRNAPSPTVNNGQPIDMNDPGALDTHPSLSKCVYSGSNGFCNVLDNGLHGNVHVLTGNGTNMGSVPFAANDPVFWAHHCNIDRLWASWNKDPNRVNPNGASFLNQAFTFSDENGVSVSVKIKDFLSIVPLHYTYDALEPLPTKCRPHKATLLESVEKFTTLLQAPPARLALTGSPVHVQLKLSDQPEAKKNLLSTMKAAPPQPHYLLLKGLEANAQPGVLYHVYLGLPEGATPKPNDPHKVGIINFFDAVPVEGAHAHDVSFSFDITDSIPRLNLTNEPLVTIAPINQPDAEAKPFVGSIALVKE
jgi:tyrosinase